MADEQEWIRSGFISCALLVYLVVPICFVSVSSAVARGRASN